MISNKQEIREKLSRKYNPDLWRDLITEIFPNRDFFVSPIVKNLTVSEYEIAGSIKQYGVINLSDNKNIALFEVELQPKKDVNKNRVELRKLISKGLLAGVKDGALVTYYSKDKSNYRFTFISKQTKITESGEFETSETDSKRFTYVLGENETCNTPADRFFKLLEISNKKISDIEDAFSVEKVSKEFFAKYKEIFERFNKFSYEHFKNLAPFTSYKEEYKEKAIRDFNKKLLGRIVFIYFLQKKGWIGVPEKETSWTGGSHKFLSENFNEIYKNTSKSFYFDFLEPLFYDTLNNKDRENSIFHITNTKVPFLNGGLFEEEKNEVKETLFYPNELFEKLFEFFDQYNFTIIEDSIEEQEVAIDPEMLGHIFENLLEDNKDKGAFYTPKEIVKYMCQEALINYLDNGLNYENDVRKDILSKDLISSFIKYGVREDNKSLIKKSAKKIENLLDDVKILDPAIGSGAFPMGMLHEIFDAKLNLDWTLDKAETKRNIIENSIYGVDIEKGAVDIAMLRFWLSLVVDEDEPSPLPNLDYKIMVGNSLTGDNVYSDNMFHKHFLDTIQKLRHEFYKTTDPEEKKKLKKQIEDETKNLSKELNISLVEGFNFKIEFSEVFDNKGGFDIVIGNPPYGANYSKEDKKIFLSNYKSAKTIKDKTKGSIDTYSLFIEKGFNCLKNNSYLTYIVPISITSSDSMTSLHEMLENNCETIKISSYSVRPQPVFENAVVNTSIISFIKTNTPVNNIFSTKMYRKNNNFNLRSLLDNLEFINVKNVKLRGRYPKISYKIETDILTNIFSNSNSIKNLQKKEGYPIYYRTTGGRYFKVITNYSTGSTQERVIFFEKEIQNVIGAILSSNLFFWFYQIYSDNLHIKSYEIESFPIPINIPSQIINEIEKAYDIYLKDIEKNCKIRQTKKYANIDSFKEYKISISKKLIDKIDDLICPLYGLDKKEIDFIKNYEIEYRITDDN